MEQKPKQSTELSPIQVFESQVSSYKGNIRDLLTTYGMSENEFMITTINAVKKTPALLSCDRKSLIGAILTSAEVGLPPNTPMQLAFILPYKRKYKDGNDWKEVSEAQFQIGYQGWVEIMQRNPKVESIDSGVVYANERWVFNKGLREPFSHEPLPPSKRGDAIGAYAIAWIKDSPKPKVVFLYQEEIMEFKKISQASSSKYSPWNEDGKDPQKWMWRKTCLKQLAKELPKTRDLSIAYHQDTVVEMGGAQTVDDEGNVIRVESEEAKAIEAKAKADEKNEKISNASSSVILDNKKD